MGVVEDECVALGLVLLPQVGMEVVEVEGHRSLKYFGGVYCSNLAKLELQSLNYLRVWF